MTETLVKVELGSGREAPAAPRPRGAAPWRRDLPRHAVIWLILAAQLLPVYMMLQISVKRNADFIAHPWLPAAPSQWRADNFAHALRLLLPYLGNSIFVCVVGTAGALAAAVGGAYFFARHRLPASRVMWGAFMLLLMMPSVINIVPLFSELRAMNLLNTLTALIVVGVASVQAFNLYVLRGFVEEIPKELFEAAEMDGASHLRQILHVVVPMSLPVLGTLAVTTFLNLWNDFLLPLVISREHDTFTVGVGLIYLDGEYVRDWGRVMAAFVMASLPLVAAFVFMMRFFVRGLAAGAVKG